MIYNNAIKWLALFGLAIFISACGQEPELERYSLKLNGKTMGTTYHITLVAEAPEWNAETLKSDIDKLLERVNDQMSTYRPDSELSRFNRYAALAPFSVSGDTALVVEEAIRLGRLTDGALDVTVGPLVNLWGFGPDAQPERVPTQQVIEQTRLRTGLDKLFTSAEALLKREPKLYVDLSAIAKGYGVDVVAGYLREQGITDFMVEIGGELRTMGSNERGVGWRIAVEKPAQGERAVQRVIAPQDNGLATSGDYRNYFERDGVRYSHTIDPATGKPINHRLVSVTVVHPSAMTADGLATAIMVMGPDKGLEFARSEYLAVLMLVKTDQGFVEYNTPAFTPYLVN